MNKIERTINLQRARYAKNPNAANEEKTIRGIIERNGGIDSVLPLISAPDLQSYLLRFAPSAVVSAVAPNKCPTDPRKSAKSRENAPKRVTEIAPEPAPDRPTETPEEIISQSVDGKVYVIDTIKKTCRRVYRDFSEMKVTDFFDIPSLDLTEYQRYFKDNFPEDSCVLKKGKLLFRGYRINISMDGFYIEDTLKKYRVVETPWEGIPTPKELGEWFKKGIRERTPEEVAAEYKEAVERGKAEKEARAAERTKAKEESEEVSVDFEELRKEVLRKIRNACNGDRIDPTEIPGMIPFKKWKRKVNSLISQWKNKKIRYPKLLKEIEAVTTEETFVVQEKNHRSEFKGTFLPEHKKVGYLRGDKIEVDDKLVDAVPFLVEYLLHYEPRAMAQVMKYFRGEITDVELIENPIVPDWKEEYRKSSLENNAHNARVITCVFGNCGIIPPQDCLYDCDLNAGDVILVMYDGKMCRRTVNNHDREVVLGKGIGLMKTDKWIKAPVKK